MAEFQMDDLTMDQINFILTQSPYVEIPSSYQPLAPDPLIENLAKSRFQSALWRWGDKIFKIKKMTIQGEKLNLTWRF